jgi:hypothetical protein
MTANAKTLVAALLAGALATGAGAQDLGRVHFQTSCTPAAQEKFDRGLAMLHSFVFPENVTTFTEAAAADTQCAIAYWGIAISHRSNPLVPPLTATALKSGLEAVTKGKAIGTRTVVGHRTSDCQRCRLGIKFKLQLALAFASVSDLAARQEKPALAKRLPSAGFLDRWRRA